MLPLCHCGPLIDVNDDQLEQHSPRVAQQAGGFRTWRTKYSIGTETPRAPRPSSSGGWGSRPTGNSLNPDCTFLGDSAVKAENCVAPPSLLPQFWREYARIQGSLSITIYAWIHRLCYRGKSILIRTNMLEYGRNLFKMH